MWLEQAIHHGAGWADAPAVSDERRTVCYGELGERTARLAAGLGARGIAAGDRVAMLSRNRVEAIEACIALSALGAVFVPFNHRLTEHELVALAQAVEVSAWVGERDLFGGLDPELVGERPCLLGEDEWEAMATHARALHPAVAQPEALSLVLLTSGTTSRPRCAGLTRRAVRASALSWLATVRPPSDAVYFSCTPLFHSTLMISLAYLGIGAHLVLTRELSPQRSLETITRFGVTHMYMVPSMLALTLRARGVHSHDYSTLTEIFHGGAPLVAQLRDEATATFGATLRDCYGQAQAGGPITVGQPPGCAGSALPSRGASPGGAGSAGQPLLGVELRIATASGAPVPAGEPGEVWVRSDALMSGYLGDPHATAEVLRDGWLHTRDIGHLDARGELHIRDRISDVIIRGGQNVYPAEVEEVLQDYPGVLEAAVVGVSDEAWGEVPVAFVVPGSGQELSLDALLAHCRGRLAPYKRAVAIELVDALPRNAGGKVRKALLREEAVRR